MALHMEAIDITLTQWLNAPAGHSPILDTAMPAITNFGVPLMIIAVALQWFVKADKPRRRHAIITSGLAFLLGQALNQIILLIIHRPRPYDAGISNLIIEKSADWSFPSDHATAVAAIAATFAILAFRKQAILFSIAALLVCCSRVYIGTHYVSDVVAGVVTGTIAAWAMSYAYRPGLRVNRWLTSIL
jgi:undecaprenyl-diphosphatase